MAKPAREQGSINIGKKTFLTALIILLLLMVTVGVLTQVVPTGSYDRQMTDGRETIIDGSFKLTQT
ncbi:MAG: hypothetical protein AAGU75_00200, partial [Bacillota bacterium]